MSRVTNVESKLLRFTPRPVRPSTLVPRVPRLLLLHSLHPSLEIGPTADAHVFGFASEKVAEEIFYSSLWCNTQVTSFRHKRELVFVCVSAPLS